MRCKKCGMFIQKGEKRCALCGTPVSRGMSSGGFTLLICFLLMLIICGIVACYLLYTKGEDYTQWFYTQPVVTASPVPTDTPEPEPNGTPMLPSDMLAAKQKAANDAANASDTTEGAVSETDAENLDALIQEGLGRVYTEEELLPMTDDQLEIIRSGMYALCGMYFSDAKLSSFFSVLDWYDPNTSDTATVEERFNDFQKQNVALLDELLSAVG